MVEIYSNQCSPPNTNVLGFDKLFVLTYYFHKPTLVKVNENSLV
jgi:hypothetical protein